MAAAAVTRTETEELRRKLSALSVNGPSSSSQSSREMEQQLSQKEEERATVQSELDDLLMVFADLEEKAAKQKVCCQSIYSSTF